MFEQVVRPAQSPQVLPTRRIVSVRQVVEVEPAGATWGKPGNMPDAIEVPAEEDPAGISFTVKKDKEYNLDYDKSTTQKVKVHNPDDPSQYVVEERLKKAVFTDKKPSTVPVYRVGGGEELPDDREKIYSPGGSTIETVAPDAGWHADNLGSQSSQFTPEQVKNHQYGLDWPSGTGEEIVSEKGPKP